MNRSPRNKMFKVTLKTERTYTVRTMGFHEAEERAKLVALRDDSEPQWRVTNIEEVSV